MRDSAFSSAVVPALAAASLLLFATLNPAWSAASLSDSQLRKVVATVGEAAGWEIHTREIPSISVALVMRDGATAAGAWGFADQARSRPATPQTIYRAGSVTHLLTDIAVMQLVEKGVLDLDAPVQRYLPEFHPRNPFGAAITLRRLMAHRSGLVREPPRGSYFDADSKGQADAVASLNDTTLVAPPGSLTKYSNAAMGVVGEILVRVTGKPYEQLLAENVLQPLGMTASAFSVKQLSSMPAHAEMASFDGPRFAAPQFELGLTAAGALYSNVVDLGRLIHMTLNRGQAGDGRLLQAETLEAMWQPQAAGDAGRRFGFGFSIADLDGHRTLGHGGTIYGHAMQILIMPDDGIGVIVFSTVDAGPTAKRIGDFALRSALAAMSGTAPPVYLRTEPIPLEEAARLSGRFVDGTDSIALRVFAGGLVLDGAGKAGEVRRANTRFYLDDAQTFVEDLRIAPDGKSITLAGRRFQRSVPGARPPPPPAELAQLVGEYGWEHNFIRIYQRDAQPYARVDWVDYARLRRIAADRYAIAEDSPYRSETLIFERDADGAVTAVSLSGIRFPRRDFGAAVTQRIRDAVKADVTALRAAAGAATPPVQLRAQQPSDFAALTSTDPTIRLDIRYAGSDNFLGIPVYERSAAYLQRPAALAVARANQVLRKQGYGLLIHDAYRPWFVTKMFWDATPPESRIFVADPAKGSRHNRGAAVDLTLFELATGAAVTMTSRYDEFSSRAYGNYVGGTDEQCWLRELLRGALEAQGFAVYPQEWWHFDYQGWERYAVHNVSFEVLESAKR